MLLSREHMKRDVIFINIACQDEYIINSYDKISNGKNHKMQQISPFWRDY